MSEPGVVYRAEEIYVNAEFAGHSGIVGVDSGSLTFVEAERIQKQWTPLAESYQLEAVKQWHPLDKHRSIRANPGLEYVLWLRRCTRLNPLTLKPYPENMSIDFLTYHVRLDTYDNSLPDYFRARFLILLGWTVDEEVGQVVYNPAALNRVNVTP